MLWMYVPKSLSLWDVEVGEGCGLLIRVNEPVKVIKAPGRAGEEIILTVTVLIAHKRWKSETCRVEVIAFEEWLNGKEQKYMFVKP